MRQKWATFAAAALLILGLSGCGSTSSRTMENNNWPRTYAVQPDGEIGRYDGYGDNSEDVLTGRDDSRYQDMLRNGRVHDTDGYLMDGENSRS